jgi:hypothetical protein
VAVPVVGSAADTSRSKRPGRSHLPLLEDAEPDAVAVPVPNRRGADVTIAAVAAAAAAGNPYKNTAYIPITFSILPSYRAVRGDRDSQSATLPTARALGLSGVRSVFAVSRCDGRIPFSRFAVAGVSIQSLE